MQLKLNLVPQKIVTKTKQALISKIEFPYYREISSIGMNILVSHDKKKVRFYSLQKVNSKSIDCYDSTGKRRNKKERIRDSHWIGYCYTIDYRILELLKLKIIQRERHFDIVNN